ncbi:hypothetical protein ACWCO0_28155 [Streptomyces tubercidicus]|uniref:hypothetical protein n=1 Tax=unclassified Streptomyces TaxID=2593676 RepID=UPI00089D909F|nr:MULTISPECIES: hypothetical protein [unclassified Streptomyces]PJJ02011.1 hypothetical protein BX264_2336 [Streptomyces sp. 2333.5]SEC91472.1 hypothetical protein SAMN05428943_2474 [Streptomyces sp. 2314.4]SED77110.1 hypothetical protein SAMN05428942_2437 [Streptomyces sp. 2112.2]
MAHYWINKEVPGARERQVHAESYGVEGDYVHFYDSAKRKVLSIRKETAFLIERSSN